MKDGHLIKSESMIPDTIRRLNHVGIRSYKLSDPLPVKPVVKGAEGGLLLLVDVPEPNCLLEKSTDI